MPMAKLYKVEVNEQDPPYHVAATSPDDALLWASVAGVLKEGDTVTVHEFFVIDNLFLHDSQHEVEGCSPIDAALH